MPLLELLQLGITSLGDKAWSLVIGAAPALAVYGITKRDVRVAKEQVTTARDEAKKEFAEAIAPALSSFKTDLLKDMNGTYLRSTEARIHFANIRTDITRLENLVIKASA